jgi:hypothetical protein
MAAPVLTNDDACPPSTSTNQRERDEVEVMNDALDNLRPARAVRMSSRLLAKCQLFLLPHIRKRDLESVLANCEPNQFEVVFERDRITRSLGLQFTGTRTGKVCVSAVKPGGGAAAATGKIRAGDQLLQLNEYAIPTNVPLDKVLKFLQAKTPVMTRFRFSRPNLQKPESAGETKGQNVQQQQQHVQDEPYSSDTLAMAQSASSAYFDQDYEEEQECGRWLVQAPEGGVFGDEIIHPHMVLQSLFAES